MLLKMGVDHSRLKPEISKHLDAIDEIFKKETGFEAVITSTYGGDHLARSKHYLNLAIDFRRPALLPQARRVHSGIVLALGRDYDVILNTEKGYIHVEYDPKA